MDFSTWQQLGTQAPSEEELLMMQLQQGQQQPVTQADISQAALAAPQAQAKPSATQAMLAQLQQAEQSALGQQRAGLGSYEKAIQNVLSQKKAGLDLTPLAALTDSWTGSKLTAAAAAQKPPSPEERTMLAAKLQDELQKRKGDYSNAQLNSIKTQLMFQLGLDKAGKGQQLPISEVEKIADASASQKALEDVKALVSANSELFGPTTGILTRAQAWAGAGATGRKASVINASLDQLAQIIGKGLEGGKLTNEDIVRYRGMLPRFGDSPEVIQDKVVSLQRLIEQKQKASIETARQAGYNTAGLEPVSGGFQKPGVDYIAGTGGAAAAAAAVPAAAAPAPASGASSASKKRLEELRAKYGRR